MQTPKLSKSGKNLVVATTNGVRSDEAMFNGQAIRAVASAWIRNDEQQDSKATEKEIASRRRED
jgi:hypothetical protein